jgi:hypothetical protein
MSDGITIGHHQTWPKKPPQNKKERKRSFFFFEQNKQTNEQTPKQYNTENINITSKITTRGQLFFLALY